MHYLLTILFAITLCSATAQAQVLKALMVNTTNGHIVATNNDLRFTNAGAVIATSFEAGEMTVSSGSIRTTEFGGALDFETGELIADDVTVFSFSGTAFILNQPVSFTSTENANASRTNLGLRLPALTNTSNVTTMRALSGSTNTNHPFSGSISVTGTNNTNTLVFSNGILQAVQ
jgi:hypothetical protein